MSDNDFLKEMGQRIMVRRKSLRMTQEELAEKLGVSTQMISNLELGKKAIRPDNLARVFWNLAQTSSCLGQTQERLLTMWQKS